MSVKTALVRFLSFLLMMQAHAKVAQDLPFETRLAVGDMLGFKVRHLGTEDCPNPQVL